VKTCVDEFAVQTDDFTDTAFYSVVCRKPFAAKSLKKFKHLAG
jgi:hypothetical protein